MDGIAVNVSDLAPIVVIHSLVSGVPLRDCVLCIANERTVIADGERVLRSSYMAHRTSCT